MTLDKSLLFPWACTLTCKMGIIMFFSQRNNWEVNVLKTVNCWYVQGHCVITGLFGSCLFFWVSVAILLPHLTEEETSPLSDGTKVTKFMTTQMCGFHCFFLFPTEAVLRDRLSQLLRPHHCQAFGLLREGWHHKKSWALTLMVIISYSFFISLVIK